VGIINGIGLKTIHKFLKNLHVSASRGFIVAEKVNKVYGWLIVYAVLYALSALTGGSFLAFLANGSITAVAIIGALLIKKHFTKTYAK
jgi:hypothetical protein